MLHSKFSITELFSEDKSGSSSHKFKTLPLSDLVDYKNSKTTCSDKGLNHSGIYIFWWTGKIDELKSLNKRILLKGKVDKEASASNQKKEHHYHKIEFSTDWFPKLKQKRYALYVGKSTDIAKRFQWHLKIKTKHKSENKDVINWRAAMDLKSEYTSVYSPTTSCQFRSGIELLLKNKKFNTNEDFWNYVKENVSFSFLTFHNDTTKDKDSEKDLFVAERFYLEDYLIGTLRPWFNIDSER